MDLPQRCIVLNIGNLNLMNKTMKKKVDHYVTFHLSLCFMMIILALLPLVEGSLAERMIAGLIISGGALSVIFLIAAILKYRKTFLLRFMANDIFSYIDLLISVAGAVIAYTCESGLLSFWVFMLALDILTIIKPVRRCA